MPFGHLNHDKDGRLGLNSIIVVNMGPLGNVLGRTEQGRASAWSRGEHAPVPRRVLSLGLWTRRLYRAFASSAGALSRDGMRERGSLPP